MARMPAPGEAMRVDGLDALEIGFATGLLWSRGDVVIAGLGPVERFDGLGAERLSDLHGELGVVAAAADCPVAGPVGFTALPFDLSVPSSLLVPAVTVVGDGDATWVVARTGGVDVEAELDRLASRAVAAEPQRLDLRSVIGPETWRDEVLTPVIARLGAGELRKVVLARELLLASDRTIDAEPILRRLWAGHRSAMVFAVDGFIGASPELLVAREGDVVSAHPLAGTAPRATGRAADEQAARDLHASAKNRVEHRITIDWLLDNLLPFCSFVDAEPEPQVITLANVHHLATRVEGRLSSPPASVLELVAALHPTPALGGDPQADALEIIAHHEPGDRGRYGGAVGWIDGAGNGEFAVGIRSGQIEGNEMRIWAGVGVVADSEPDAELEETRAKFQAMLGAVVRL